MVLDPVADLLARVRAMAHRFYHQQGRWEPFEEYLSAGHLALAECLQRYDPAQAPPGGFKSYCLFQVEMAMRDVRRVAAGPWNMPRHQKGTYQEPKYPTESVDHEVLYALRTTPATQETTTYLHEIVGYLAQYGKATAMLYATIDGEEQADIAAHWQCGVENVRKHCMTLRRNLRTWAQWSAA
jgi:DNA-directed RNA polymerase specialized sigma subunit